MLKLAIPVLRVSNSVEAEAFYCQRLGFARQFAYRPHEGKTDPWYMGLARDGVSIHVDSVPGAGAPRGSAFLIVDDLDALHAEFEPYRQRFGLEIEKRN